jgi:hypothetical protein
MHRWGGDGTVSSPLGPADFGGSGCRDHDILVRPLGMRASLHKGLHQGLPVAVSLVCVCGMPCAFFVAYQLPYLSLEFDGL